jgi:predicted  nucleic acid-binding Zn-ribbon protein
MSDTTGTRTASTTWIPWVAALLGFGFQIIWFSSQFGSLSARIEDSERRVQAIEANGSPVVQAIRTEVSINSRRISSLEEQYGTKVSGVLTDNAAHAEQLRHLQGNMDSLLQWRVSHIGEDANMDGRLTEIDRQLQQLQAQQATLVRDLAVIPHPRPRP